jgi:ribosomal protein S18 acetylase RimI-like enzyme
MPELLISPVRQPQLAAVVAVHVKAFPDSAITALGVEAVRRYYEWLIEGPHDAELTGAWDGTRLLGFCAAGVFRGAMNGFLRRNRRYLALRIATHPQLVLNPLIRDRLVRALKITLRFSRLARPTSPPTAAPAFGVLAIATDPDARGAGAGRALMIEAEERAIRLGYERMVLTVHPSNQRAVRFYEQLGWVRLGNDPVWSGAMEKPLAD